MWIFWSVACPDWRSHHSTSSRASLDSRQRSHHLAMQHIDHLILHELFLLVYMAFDSSSSEQTCRPFSTDRAARISEGSAAIVHIAMPRLLPPQLISWEDRTVPATANIKELIDASKCSLIGPYLVLGDAIRHILLRKQMSDIHLC